MDVERAVASFFTPVSQKEPEKITWRVVKQSLLVGTSEPTDIKDDVPAIQRRKIAAFDFVLFRSLWKAVSTNQGGISLRSDPKTVKSDQKRLSDFKAKVSLVFAQLDFPIAIYAATARDQYRKPRTGMWHELIEDLDLDIGDGPDLAGSFFIGDAGGRQAASGGRGDHSCSDRSVTHITLRPHDMGNYSATDNADYTTGTLLPMWESISRPRKSIFSNNHHNRILEVSVLRHTLALRRLAPQIQVKQPDLRCAANADGLLAPIVFDKKNKLDLVVLCGSPGAGKSTFYWNHLKPLGYERVNQDILKTVNLLLCATQVRPRAQLLTSM
ncbi:MAG: hypothetical protein LQ347_002725 [Umbilicaria vellea]|nr:MAG: hypothetical protein LQ347_002725 [Umbilicaria vellea]